MRSSMPRRALRFLVVPAAVLVVGGCFIATNHQAGAPCESREQCLKSDGTEDAAYDCVDDGTGEGTRTCQIVFPPIPVPVDAGEDPDGGNVQPTGPVYWCNQIEPLMKTYCISCHGEDRSGSFNTPIRLDHYEDVDVPDGGVLKGAKTVAERIKVRTVDFQNMPPSPPKPNESERDLLTRWVQAGAPFCDGGM